MLIKFLYNGKEHNLNKYSKNMKSLNLEKLKNYKNLINTRKENKIKFKKRKIFNNKR